MTAMGEKPGGAKVFFYSCIDGKDETEEKLERAKATLQRIVGSGSEREMHDAMHTAACRDKATHDDVCLGLLMNILIDSGSAVKCFRDLTLITRDNHGVVVDVLVTVAADKYLKLSDLARFQLIWLTKELVRASVNGAEILCWNLLRQVAGGDISNRNLWLAENMLEMFVENRPWVDRHPILVASIIFTYLRILEDHFPAHLANLKQKEVNFIVPLIRESFTTVCMNPNLGLGRDLLRLLQAISRIPEIEAIWLDLCHNPKALSPHCNGIAHILAQKTSRKYLQLRITPEMEKKMMFLTSHVKFGFHKRYQEWFQRQFLATIESQTLRADIIRYIVGVIHPPNEILCSDVLPRWAVIGWLLTTCTNPVAAANAKLALFFDWLAYDPVKDNIMNIEPGMLVMYHSIRPHLAITATLLDFLIRLIAEFWPAGSPKIQEGVGAAFKSILDKKVLQSLEPVLENNKLEPELRLAIQSTLVPLIYPGGQSSQTAVTPTQPSVITLHEPALLSPVKKDVPVVDLEEEPESNSTEDLLMNEEAFTPPTVSSDEEEDEDDEDDRENIAPAPSTPTKEGLISTLTGDEERSNVFGLVQKLPTNIRVPLDRMMSDSCNDKNDCLEDIIEECFFATLEKDQREALSKALIYLYKEELESPCIGSDNMIKPELEISPVSQIVDVILQSKPSDRTLKTRSLYRLLADISSAFPHIPSKIILLVHQKFTAASNPKEQTYVSLYKTLATTYRGLKLEAALAQDIKECWKAEPTLVGYLCPIIYDWYSQECVGSLDILRVVVSSLDAFQLQDIVWQIAKGDVHIFDDGDLISVISKSLDWETWEQHCVWTMLAVHQYEIEDLLPIVPTLDYVQNAEALTAMFMTLKDEKPTDVLLGPCMCRKPNPNDRFVLTLLMCWSETHEETLAEVLTGLLVRAYGSPVKRKRGGGGAGRGTASPAGPATPNVDYVLGHLELLRQRILRSGVFATDSMQAALLQVQSWVTEQQKYKYKDLLAMAATEETNEPKDVRGSKRGVAGRSKAPASPTSGGGGNSAGGSGSTSLPRTRSGRTRQKLKDDSETSSSNDEDDIIVHKNSKKRKKTSALASDSD